ncbi:tRNA (adenosine(37)-N6)-dimethylallyltransferase MiaA [Candidatus Saccharibacteria bacterium]|nr:tRNA (adenosine(37)-N6)-dimethylallyltransferase MiaA [Candidatus Saccharibacteria bacterium]MCB9821257.1 tRNA (adenosine(37)-N6)-dimethylallyltransferase MiaA [Candidatus Nomurabacteria bacterium]
MKIDTLFIVGQTASGKSSLAMRLAKVLDGEIIAADSLTVYKGLDIGTAKPTQQDMRAVKHHMIDVADQSKPFTVSDFQTQAKQAITNVHAKGKLAIVVGGSGLYVNSLLYDYKLGPAANTAERAEYESKTIEQLQSIILNAGYDLPENSQNKRYLIRAIEQGGVRSGDIKMINGALVIGIRLDKDVLGERIRLRLKRMLDDGVLKEVQLAYERYDSDSEALKGNIYQSLRPYFYQQISINDALENSVRSDLKLAKKQYAWFKRNQAIYWFSDTNKAFKFVVDRLSQPKVG